jgi:hypothetical protein
MERFAKCSLSCDITDCLGSSSPLFVLVGLMPTICYYNYAFFWSPQGISSPLKAAGGDAGRPRGTLLAEGVAMVDG